MMSHVYSSNFSTLIIAHARGDGLVLRLVLCVVKAFCIFWCIMFLRTVFFRPLYLYLPKFYYFICWSFICMAVDLVWYFVRVIRALLYVCWWSAACVSGGFIRMLMICSVCIWRFYALYDATAAYVSGGFMHYTMPLQHMYLAVLCIIQCHCSVCILRFYALYDATAAYVSCGFMHYTMPRSYLCAYHVRLVITNSILYCVFGVL
jgi:hypothetical protein